MGKRIIQQARGKGSGTYRVRRKAFRYRLKYPRKLEGEGMITKLVNSTAHTAPLAKVRSEKGEFFIPAFKGAFEGQELSFENVSDGSILRLGDMPVKTKVYCIESKPGDGGVFVKTAGTNGTISRIIGEKVMVMMPSKKEKAFNPDARAVIGEIAGGQRVDKPIVKAGKMHYIKKIGRAHV